ncbi:MAG: leucyl aminopeptidase [Candidatus Dormibacteraeota bacterium]|nr:leucyl aminopeptidase [Candidatus Dormibacteraeota bacterium]
MTVAMRGDASPGEIGGDALVVTAFAGELGAAAAEIDQALDGELRAMVASGEVKGRLGEVTVVRSGGAVAAQRVVVLGLGDRAVLDGYRLHNAYTFAGRELRRRRLPRAVLVADTSLAGTATRNVAALLRAMVTGLLLANFDAGVSKSDTDASPQITDLVVAGFNDDDGDEVQTALADAVLLAESTIRVQQWVNLPSNMLTPTAFAESVRELCAGTSVGVEVLDRAALEAAGAGALLGIAQGSSEPPVMIVLRHDGGGDDGPRLALIGKGITFDTGGISIKPSLGMESMKADMGGGAAVLAAVLAIAALAVPANVVGIVPATENMPGGKALKPGDVVSAMDGTTIEVVNTDAEGRVVLADGLAYARRIGATHLVDVATLTGAAVVALGHVTTALMTSDPGLASLVQRAGEEAGDRFAELPMHPEYDACLHSEVADVRNWAGRQAGTISGGIFIRAFSGGLPWVHLDIAGTSWNDQANLKDVPSGPTGSPVRTLVWLARLFARL